MFIYFFSKQRFSAPVLTLRSSSGVVAASGFGYTHRQPVENFTFCSKSDLKKIKELFEKYKME